MKTDAGPTDLYLFEEALLAMDREVGFSIVATHTNMSDLADSISRYLYAFNVRKVILK